MIKNIKLCWTINQETAASRIPQFGDVASPAGRPGPYLWVARTRRTLLRVDPDPTCEYPGPDGLSCGWTRTRRTLPAGYTHLQISGYVTLLSRNNFTLSNCCRTLLIGSSASWLSSLSTFCWRSTSWCKLRTALKFKNENQIWQMIYIQIYKITLPSSNVFSAAVVWIKFHSFSARLASISARSRWCCKSPIRLFNVKISLLFFYLNQLMTNKNLIFNELA